MIPDEHLPPEFLKWFLEEAGQRPAEKELIDLALDVQDKLKAHNDAEQLFEHCRRYDLMKEIGFKAWHVAKKQK